MTERTRYVAGPDVGPDEIVHDSQGRVVDDAYAAAATDDALAQVRGPGRPSLSSAGESPLLRVRLPRDLDDAVRRAAENAGISRSTWVRDVLADATRRAS